MATIILDQATDEQIQSISKHGAITERFPRSDTLDRIRTEYSLLVRHTKTIIVFGQLKCHIIDTILENNHRSKCPAGSRLVSSNEIKNNMIRSQYELYDRYSGVRTVVTEHTAKEIAQCAAPNLKYFPVFKDEFPERVMDSWNTRQTKKYEMIYEGLSQFTTETLKNTSYSKISDYSILCMAFIGRYENEENVSVPLDVVRLIAAYFECAAPMMNLFRIQEPNGDILNFCETSCSTTSMSHWSQMALNHRVDGFIFMVDLMWYNEYFVDENGQKVNRLEHAVWQWNKRVNRNRPFGIMILVNLESFIQKTKVLPPSVCRLFSGMDNSETINWTKWSLERICQKQMDVYDRAIGGWSVTGKVIDYGCEDDGHYSVKIHYNGYHSRYDEWLPVDSKFLAPLSLYSQKYGFCKWFQTINAMSSIKKLTWDTYLC